MTKMSRVAPTKAINSLVATAVAASSIGLVGCAPSDDVTVKVYNSAETCARLSGDHPSCSRDEQQAHALHAQVAPRYDDKKDCEEDFGDGLCEMKGTPSATASHGGGAVVVHSHPYYSPYYSGYSTGSYAHSGSSLAAQPVYRTKTGSYLTSGGTSLRHGATVSAADLSPPATPARFAAGTSMAKGHAAAAFSKAGGGAYAKGGSVARAGGFGSAGRAGGVSMGG